MATGAKTNNGIVSQSAAAVQGERDGQNLKTILEYAEERGLSTGVISNDYPTGVASALVSAFYAHHNTSATWALAVAPFIPGEIVKITAAAGIFNSLQRWRQA